MGRRGPKPEPSAAKKARGTYRADRRRGEPQVGPGAPAIPTWLKPRSRKHWRVIAPLLEEAGLLTRLDQVALGLLTDSLADYLTAREILEAEAAKPDSSAFITVTDRGNIIQHPAVGVLNKAWERLVKLLQQFGMTPSARAGLHLGDTRIPDDPMADLLGRIAARREATSPN